MLTSVTTFMGLSPMLFERSVQAQAMVPMAISLAFGILFATMITLFLVPCLYLMLDDLDRWWTGKRAHSTAAGSTAAGSTAAGDIPVGAIE
jgi:predicted RND superfamily exporter protein